MGCWDIFCFLCGNTCHGSFSDLEEKFLEDIEYYEKIMNSKNKKDKFYIDYFKPIYNNYKKDPKSFLQSIKSLRRNTFWLNKCTFLGADGTINHNCKEISCNISFQDNKGNSYINETFFSNIEETYGIFVHTDCWKFIKKEYKINLSYKYLPINKTPVTENKVFNFINYGKIESYWAQDFDFIKLISDNNEELCKSPLKSEIVGKNIKKVFTKLKIRDDLERKSPLVSATFYKPGIYRVGNNVGIWTIKGGKWIELKNTVTTTINNIKHIKKISYLYDVNTIPIFISKITGKNITIVTTKEMTEKII
jgi:hypothetical protein